MILQRYGVADMQRESILHILKNSSILLEESTALAKEVKDILPSVTAIVDVSNERLQNSLDDVDVAQKKHSSQLDATSSSIHNHLAQLTTIQSTSFDHQALHHDEFKAWQVEFRSLVEDFMKSAQERHDHLIEEVERLKSAALTAPSVGVSQLGFGAVQVFASGVASWAGAMIAFSQQKTPSGGNPPPQSSNPQNCIVERTEANSKSGSTTE